MKLTPASIAKIVPRAARTEYPDNNGLRLVVQPTGSMSWAVQFRVAGKPAKLTLGDYPKIELPEARALAADALAKLAKGNDPRPEKEAPVDASEANPGTVGAAFDEFCRKRLHKKNLVRESSRSVMEPALKRALSPWMNRPLWSITRREIANRIEEIEEPRINPVTGRKLGGPGAGEKARMVLSAFYKWNLRRWARDEDPSKPMPPSPVAYLDPMPERIERERTLTDDEVAHLWHATERVEPWLKVFVRTLLLTGQRRAEVAGIEWIEIVGDEWHLPALRNKAGRPHLIPLAPHTLAMLNGQERVGPHIFTSDGQTHRSNYDRMKKAVDAAIAADGLPALPRWTFHDLRRTCATGLLAQCGNRDVVDKILNHAVGKLQRTYQKHEFKEEKRKALIAWEEHVLKLVAPPGNIVTIGAAKKKTTAKTPRRGAA